jgi:hypothetical protein
MRGTWIGAAVVASLAVLAVGPASAQNQPAQPSIMDPDQPDQTTPPKPARHSHRATTRDLQPDLDTDDQLAPSQIKQPIPAAVAEPSGAAAAKQARPAQHAAADAPQAAPPAPPKKPAVTTAPAAAAAMAAHVVACSGAFSKESSHLRLAMTFDSKNVAFADVDASNGSKVPASVVFPTDPKRRLEVWWSNAAERRDTYLIVINGKSTWTAPGGMKLGLTIPQLEKLNHKPFKLKGFDKDGVATVSDWDGGVLATIPGGCKSGLSLHADPKVSADALSQLSSDKEFSSSDDAIRAAKPTVSEILIGY